MLSVCCLFAFLKGFAWRGIMNAMATKTSDNSIKRVYAYHGIDDGRKRTELEKLISKLIEPDFKDFDLENLYGPDVTSDRLVTACAMAPFGSKRRVVVVSQANDISAPEQSAIAKRLGTIPESTCLIFVTPAPAIKDGKAKKGSELNEDLMKAVKKAGQAVDFGLLKEPEATALIRELVSHEGKTISNSAAAILIRRCGSDSGILSGEVAKLASYVGDNKVITDDDVEQVTIQTVEEKIFALMDAVGTRKPTLAINYLHPILHGDGNDSQGEALRTLTMIARHFRSIWQARALMDAGCKVIAPGKVPEHLENMLPADNNIMKLRDWQLSKFVTQARNFTMGELARCFDKILAADLTIKGIEGDIADPALALEILVVELSSRQESKKGRY